MASRKCIPTFMDQDITWAVFVELKSPQFGGLEISKQRCTYTSKENLKYTVAHISNILPDIFFICINFSKNPVWSYWEGVKIWLWPELTSAFLLILLDQIWVNFFLFNQPTSMKIVWSQNQICCFCFNTFRKI